MLIEIKKIDRRPGFTVKNTAKYQGLKISMQSLGLLQALNVMPAVEDAARFKILSGNHRHLGAEELGWTHIECTIRDADEVEAEMVTIAENLWRFELETWERDKYLHRYHELFILRHPELEAIKQNGKAVKPQQTSSRPPVDQQTGRVIPPPPSREQVINTVARELGVGATTLRESIKRSEGLDDESSHILDQAGLTIAQKTKIATMKPEQKVECIKLIAAGITYAETMGEVLGEKYTPAGSEEDDIDNETWLRQCKARAKANQRRFDQAALEYRRIRAARMTFARAIGWEAMKNSVNLGNVYTLRLQRFLEVPHPKDWRNCPKCKEGLLASGECDMCKGGGFIL